jgi:hypothetical protein
MQNDPTTYILASALLGSCLGFFAAALLCARTVRRANIEAWKEARVYFTKLYSTPKN